MSCIVALLGCTHVNMLSPTQILAHTILCYCWLPTLLQQITTRHVYQLQYAIAVRIVNAINTSFVHKCHSCGENPIPHATLEKKLLILVSAHDNLEGVWLAFMIIIINLCLSDANFFFNLPASLRCNVMCINVPGLWRCQWSRHLQKQ